MYAIYEHLAPYVYKFYPILGQVNQYEVWNYKLCLNV